MADDIWRTVSFDSLPEMSQSSSGAGWGGNREGGGGSGEKDLSLVAQGGKKVSSACSREVQERRGQSEENGGVGAKAKVDTRY